MNPKIFISRELGGESDFLLQLLQEFPQSQIHGASLLQFSPLTFELPATFDGVFFYSRKGAAFFLNQLSNPRKFLRGKFIGAFGQSTANYLERTGIYPKLIGDGDAEAIAKSMLPDLAGKIILFPQALSSKNSLQPFLADQLKYLPLKVYENSMKEVGELPHYDALVFTSPMNVASYLQANELDGQTIVAIGKTTAAAIREHTKAEIIIAARPYEKEMAEALIKELGK